MTVLKQQINYSLPLYLIIFSGTVFLLFFAESNLYATRSWSHLWNLGHIPLFMLISYAVYRIVPSISSSSLILQVLLFAGMALVLGAMIEFVQSFVGRQASMQDVMLDMIGGVIFVLVFSPTLRSICLYKKVMLVLLVTSLLVVASSKLIFSAWDEYHAYRDFPLLADFEYEREIKRWTSSDKMMLTDAVALTGRRSLRVDLRPRLYSGVEMQYFPRDWSDYKQLVLHVYHPEVEPISLTVSIFDEQHPARHFVYADRFTKRFRLSRGWNALRVSLHDVESAPRKRRMDMSGISGLRLFVTRPHEGQQLFFDGIRLE